MPLRIRRSHVVEDTLGELGRLDAQGMKSTFTVFFVNEFGEQEAGIDQSGLTKEFLEEACVQIFSPDLVLFSRTEESGRMYPNPLSAINPEHLQVQAPHLY